MSVGRCTPNDIVMRLVRYDHGRGKNAFIDMVWGIGLGTHVLAGKGFGDRLLFGYAYVLVRVVHVWTDSRVHQPHGAAVAMIA
jgi:hypothetical protein